MPRSFRAAPSGRTLPLTISLTASSGGARPLWGTSPSATFLSAALLDFAVPAAAGFAAPRGSPLCAEIHAAQATRPARTITDERRMTCSLAFSLADRHDTQRYSDNLAVVFSTSIGLKNDQVLVI